MTKESAKGMSDGGLEITPSVTVHALLQAYPELEEVLIGIAAPFKKLRNPVLRKSVAKVATLRHAAAVGNVSLNQMIEVLREAVGQQRSASDYDDEDYFVAQPGWFSEENIALKLNETTVDNENEMTLGPILRGARHLSPGEIIELSTTFLPAPGIDIMRRKGYAVWVQKLADNDFRTYFLKNPAD